ncbi:hypothetical protein [Bradyrhizobium sp. SZCCHNS3018]|uniref:hypothetical protein n=1 Tax=Bradyrhizobium sp. SZCCHNS3018 TaxID=3057319 RepID=UPI002915CD78|nr:hypothetical protein [Bradyrhizobium sp. SZCCHNS3018]
MTEIVLREPSGEEYLDLGLPYRFMQIGPTREPVDIESVVKEYLQRCIVKPDPLLAMSGLSLIDAIAVKDAFMRFFIAEPAKGSNGSPGAT